MSVGVRWLLGPWALWGFSLVLWLSIGFSANSMMLQRARKVIAQADAEGWSDFELARRGGVSWRSSSSASSSPWW
jgi:hypothetical protein